MHLTTDQIDPLHILRSTRNVLASAHFLTIHTEAIPQLAAALEGNMQLTGVQPPSSAKDESALTLAVQKAFIFNVLNFCFWAEHEVQKWVVEWPKGTIIEGGAYALLAALNRAETNGYPIYDANYLAHLSYKDAYTIFRGNTEIAIPLLKQRINNLREAGRVLCNRASGKFLQVVRASGHDAIDLVRALVHNFSSFNDTTTFNEQKVYFHKRAQICAHHVALLAPLFPECHLYRSDQLTIFADYRLPQVYRHFNVLHYLPELTRVVDTRTLVPLQSRAEVEIRSATVWIAELVRQHFEGKYSAVQIDNATWLLSQKIKKEMLPHHRTYTIYY